VATNRFLLDSGALTALAEDDKRLRLFLETAVIDDIDIAVPTIVIAESTTGGQRDAKVNRVLARCDIIDLTEPIARDAARLRTALRGAGLADAIIIATADRERGTTVLTSDPTDLRALAVIANRSAVVSFLPDRP
jgi:predicted nucleic acid-binding protein